MFGYIDHYAFQSHSNPNAAFTDTHLITDILKHFWRTEKGDFIITQI